MARTAEQTSAIMRAIRSKDTKPEMIVRRLLHSEGYRYRLHRKEIPGRPDVAFIGRKKAIFVHGCFWHQHPDPSCKLSKVPKTRLDYWLPKLKRNVARDRKSLEALERAGWQALIVWECELGDLEKVMARLVEFIGPQKRREPARR